MLDMKQLTLRGTTMRKGHIWITIIALLVILGVILASTSSSPPPLTEEECHAKFWEHLQANPGMSLTETLEWSCQ